MEKTGTNEKSHGITSVPMSQNNTVISGETNKK